MQLCDSLTSVTGGSVVPLSSVFLLIKQYTGEIMDGTQGICIKSSHSLFFLFEKVIKFIYIIFLNAFISL